MNEPIGVMGLIAPTEAPLLGFLSWCCPPIAMGNCGRGGALRKVAALATDLYQVFETSDVTGRRDQHHHRRAPGAGPVLAAHDDVDAIWFYRSARRGRRGGETLGRKHEAQPRRMGARGLAEPDEGEGEEFLRESTQVKNIWVPYGA
jgi:aldehyde dehydrogenase (NAD+)